MSITILQRSPQGMRSIKLGNPYLYGLVCLLIITPIAAAMTGYYFAQAQSKAAQVDQLTVEKWKTEISNQWKELELAKDTSQQQINALTAKVGIMQAQIRRLDAAGERVVSIAGLDKQEFSFEDNPAVGGPEDIARTKNTNIPQLFASLYKIDQQLDSREQQLAMLESLLMEKQMGVERYISGRPVSKGWLSSYYGERSDPFSGQPAWHGGVDFAGKEGSEVVATAAGVISWVGERYGYGLLIEINHGDGMVTRYGHNKTALVNQGDVIAKSQVIAKMGNSGRSTGAHVHYEILKEGRNINPLTYINRRAKN